MPDLNTTHARITGALLVAGWVAFWIGAFTPPYKQWMGPPIKEYLQIIGAHRTNWLFINGSFVLGVALTGAGLAGLAALQRRAGEPFFADLGLYLFAVGAVLWFASLAFRLTVTPWAAEELARTGDAPAGYEAQRAWSGVMFAIYMVFAYFSIAAFGKSLLASGLVAPWLGWTVLVFGLVAVPGFATPLFQPPLMVHLVPGMIGLALLWRGAP